MRRLQAARRRGFTLTELMVVMLLMGMAIAIFSASFPAAGQSLYRSRHMDIAGNVCNQQLDFWRNVGYGSVPAFPQNTVKVTQSFNPSTELPGAVGTVTFTRVDDSFNATTADTGQVRIDVTVTWGGSGNDRGTVNVTSMLVQ